MQDVLPDQYLHKVCSFQEDTVPGGWSAELRLAESTERGAQLWLARYQDKSMTVMRVHRTFGYDVTTPRINLFKKSYRCHHNTRSRVKKLSLKGTDCVSCMTITVKRVGKLTRKSRSTDPHLPDYPMRVCLRYSHNHPIRASSALRFRDVRPSVEEKFRGLFRLGYGPVAALGLHKMDLQLEHGSNFMHICGDRAQVPDEQWCRRLHRKLLVANNEKDGQDVLGDLQTRMTTENASGDMVMDVCTTVDGQVVVAICSKLMKRVLSNVPQSHELITVDHCGAANCDSLGAYLLLTHSCIGGLPVGCIITTSETTPTVTAALQLYKSLVPTTAFRGGAGPKVFMTDECPALQSALREIFPESSQLLSVFHILQAAWRWLWNSKKKIEKQDRPELFGILKSLLYCQSLGEMDVLYQRAAQNAVVMKYKQFSQYLLGWYSRSKSWAVCCRQDLQLQGSFTSDYGERATRVLKEQILNRLKVQNVVQLVDFVLDRMEKYHTQGILDVVSGCFDSVKYSRYLPQEAEGELIIRQTSECAFTVASLAKPDAEYTVNTLLGHCTCPTPAAGGALCKHQNAVALKYNLQCCSFIPISNTRDKARFYYVATGNSSLPEWLQPLVHQTDVTVCVSTNSPVPNTEQEGCHNQAPPPESCPEPSDVDATKNDVHVPIPPEVHIAEVQTLVECLQEDFVSVLRNKMTRHPDVYIPAVKRFLSSVKKLKTDSQVLSGLLFYGGGTGLGSRIWLSGRKRIDDNPSNHVTPQKKTRLGENSCP
ncbi:uncharacterized protein LOC110989183 [Acanthaster planci]|uniref:Uncharacterized protein LOC110989183 n=1 Tax=Acanthaster planci TaxID=133434 RepID=A0A8B7ZU16_ACAPL|nr:uncharacterized protein LOC110989183 [Acanthaster planci]